MNLISIICHTIPSHNPKYLNEHCIQPTWTDQFWKKKLDNWEIGHTLVGFGPRANNKSHGPPPNAQLLTFKHEGVLWKKCDN